MGRRSLRLSTLTCISACALLLLPAATAVGDGNFAERVEGTWEGANSKEEARRNINAEIEKVVGKMFFVKRPFARNELKDATEPCDQIAIETGDEHLSITCDDRKPAVTEGKGTPRNWVSKEGEKYTMSQKLEDDRIVETFDGDSGIRTNTYRLTDNETLVMKVKIKSGQLPVPLTYSRTFEK